MLTPCFGAVGCVKRGHADTVSIHILEQICKRRIASHAPSRKALGIDRVVPTRGHLRPAQLPAVIAHVKNLRGNVVEKRKKATNALGNVCLAYTRNATKRVIESKQGERETCTKEGRGA
jgi:hypothetical protein